jgi:hypothetical protein
MKKILLSLFLTVFVSIGAWAQNYALSEDTWCSSTANEKAVVIELKTAGKLSEAITAAATQYPNYDQVFIKTADGVVLDNADIIALGSLSYETIDLQDAQCSAAFTFQNSTVKNLILPNGWTKEEVTTCAKAVGAQLGSAISLASYKGGTVGTQLNAYVNKGNTLYDAVNRTFLDNTDTRASLRSEGKMFQSNMKKTNLKCLSIAGNPVARDFSGNDPNTIKFTEDGHFQFDQEADENSWVINHGVNDEEGKGTRKLVGTRTDGAMDGASLVELDLKDAVITDKYCNDLTLSWTGVLGDKTLYVKIPECKELTILPADFIAHVWTISEICIPSNIQTIKTRAFAASVDHIWTTKAAGDIDNTTYDNGLVNEKAEQILGEDGKPLLGYTDQEFSHDISGTYTFSSNLKLIERFAFSNSRPYVSDVYVLAVEAPECHVDAFGTEFYVCNSGYGVAPDGSGIITRASFRNGDYWMTMLHYPRECTTPQIQRYTDPTRQYSIATGLTDGKGAQIYFPLFGEFKVAYIQGTYGYTWNAFDVESRTNYGDLALSIPETNQNWSAAKQGEFNTYFTGEDPTATFYDVTLGENTKPAGLQNYYDVVWEGQKLYPRIEYVKGAVIYDVATAEDAQNGKTLYELTDGTYTEYTGNFAEYTGTLYVARQTQATNQYGELQYEKCGQGSFVKNYIFNKKANGAYIHDITATEAPEGTTPSTDLYVQDYEYVAFNGTREEGVTYYYHPYQAWDWNPPTPKNLYYKKETYIPVTDGGDFTHVKSSWGAYATKEDAKNNWYWTDEQIASAEHYNLEISYPTWSQETGPQGVTVYFMTAGYAEWSSSVGNVPLYTKEYLEDEYRAYNAETDEGEKLYSAVEDNGYVKYDETNPAHADRQRYERVWDGTYRLAVDENEEPDDRYCPKMEDAKETTTIQHDYRGWHQFVLTGYAANTDVPMISYRSYLTDTDWWTLCSPFDMNYNDAMLILGDPGTGKIPFVSQLLNVIRDEEKGTITLNFSENLMLHKATKDTDGNWVVSETEEPSKEEDAQDDDIVIHAGVPYLIRPNFISGRQFDIYPDLSDYPSAKPEEISEGRIIASHTDYPGLFEKIKNAENRAGNLQRELQQKGIVTVPALVAGESSETTVSGKTVTYNGVTYPVSAEWDYSFVGAFYNNMMPANSYYLGYNNKQKKAMFYVATQEAASVYNGFKWINNTAVICPNLLSNSASITRTYNLGLGSHNGEVTPGSGSGQNVRPAQWIINSLVLDDLGTASGSNGFSMGFGNMTASEGTEGIENMKVVVNAGGKVYTIDGRYVGDSIYGLSKGVYIQNGKKLIVK